MMTTCLDESNLTKVRPGVWQDEATGQLVCKIGAEYWVRPHLMYWAVVGIKHGLATARTEGGSDLNAEHQGYLDAAFMLADRIATIYNARAKKGGAK